MKAIHYYNPDTPVTFKIRFPDGSEYQNRPGAPDITITVKHWSSFFRLAFFGSYGFATDYVKQRIDIDGDLRHLGYLVFRSANESHLDEAVKRGVRTDPPLVYLLDRWHMLMHQAWNFRNARFNAEFHYGLHPDFYFNYLGPTGAYSTGFWYEDTKNVDESQHIKWEFILKKLRLDRPGLRIASVGSGFGYGELMAAEKYGAIVDCYNVCRPQNEWLRGEVKRRGLEGRVNVFDEEYRILSKKPSEYDRLLVIECIEHAQDLYRKATIAGFAKCLKDDGIGVMQWLSYDINSDVALFIRKYLYPGVTMPPLGRMIDEVSLAGFEILDLVCNRRHYYYTLNAWTDNLIKNWDKIRAIDPVFYNESFRRKWLLYLSSGAFYLVTPDATARLYNLTFAKGDTYTYPMNREFLYSDGASLSPWVKPHKWVMGPIEAEPAPSPVAIEAHIEQDQ